MSLDLYSPPIIRINSLVTVTMFVSSVGYGDVALTITDTGFVTLTLTHIYKIHLPFESGK